MSRSIKVVLFEALIIGIMNAALIFGMGKMNFKIEGPLIHLIAGSLIHLIF